MSEMLPRERRMLQPSNRSPTIPSEKARSEAVLPPNMFVFGEEALSPGEHVGVRQTSSYDQHCRDLKRKKNKLVSTSKALNRFGLHECEQESPNGSVLGAVEAASESAQTNRYCAMGYPDSSKSVEAFVDGSPFSCYGDDQDKDVSTNTYADSNEEPLIVDVGDRIRRQLAREVTAIRKELEATKSILDKVVQDGLDTLAQLQVAQIMQNSRASTQQQGRPTIKALQKRIAELEDYQVIQQHVSEQRRRDDAKKDAKIDHLEAQLARLRRGDGGLQAKLDEKNARIAELEWENALKSRTIASTAALANRVMTLYYGQSTLDTPQISRLSHPGYISRLLVQAERAQEALSARRERPPAAQVSVSEEDPESDSDKGSLYCDPEADRMEKAKAVRKDQKKREKAMREQRLQIDSELPENWTPEQIRLSIDKGIVTAEALALQTPVW